MEFNSTLNKPHEAIEGRVMRFISSQYLPVPTIEIAKAIFGLKATTKHINPILYPMQSKGLIYKTSVAENGRDPRWSIRQTDPVPTDQGDLTVFIRGEGRNMSCPVRISSGENVLQLKSRYSVASGLCIGDFWFSDRTGKPMRDFVMLAEYEQPFTAHLAMKGGASNSPPPPSKPNPKIRINKDKNHKIWKKKDDNVKKTKEAPEQDAPPPTPVKGAVVRSAWSTKFPVDVRKGRGRRIIKIAKRGFGVKHLSDAVKDLDAQIKGARDAKLEIVKDIRESEPEQKGNAEKKPKEKPKKPFGSRKMEGKEFNYGKIEVPIPIKATITSIGSCTAMAVLMSAPMIGAVGGGIAVTSYTIARMMQCFPVVPSGVSICRGVTRADIQKDVDENPNALSNYLRIFGFRQMASTIDNFRHFVKTSYITLGSVSLVALFSFGLNRVMNLATSFFPTASQAVRVGVPDLLVENGVPSVIADPIGEFSQGFFDSATREIRWATSLASYGVKVGGLGFTLIGLATALATLQLWSHGRPITYRRTARIGKKCRPTPTEDKRNDESSQMDIIHEDEANVKVKFIERELSFAGVSIDEKEKDEVASMEALTQLVTARTLVHSTTPEMAEMMIDRAASNLQSVNTDRTGILALEKDDNTFYTASKVAYIVVNGTKEKDESFHRNFRMEDKPGVPSDRAMLLMKVAFICAAIAAARLCLLQ
jgi:hypothetical protein